MSLTAHRGYRMNTLITHVVSQLRTTPGQGGRKILRVWKEVSGQNTEHSTPKSLSLPSTKVTLGKTCPCSSSFLVLFSPLGWLPWSYAKSQLLIKCCSMKASQIPLSQISCFPTHIPTPAVHIHYNIYHVILLLHIYYSIYFSLSCYFMVFLGYQAICYHAYF